MKADVLQLATLRLRLRSARRKRRKRFAMEKAQLAGTQRTLTRDLNLNRAIARRSVAGSPALETGADLLSHALLRSPELVGVGAVGLAQAGAGAIEVVGGAADGVFESVIAIIESLF